MGKGSKKKKDPEKRAMQRFAKEAKADRKAMKRMEKERARERSADGGDDGGEEGAGDAATRPGGVVGGGGGGSTADGGGGDDIDSILASYAKRSIELTSPVVEPIDEPWPSPPRGNFSLTAPPGSSGEFVMFGGEYYDGAENVVFDELLRWDPDGRREGGGESDDDDDDEDRDGERGAPGSDPDAPGGGGGAAAAASSAAESEADHASTCGLWRRVLSPPPTPPARCSHSAVWYDRSLWIFGGEMATAERYHHYRDLWRFDLRTNSWEEVTPRGPSHPQARSGHRALVWRHYMIVFGGFYEALKETRWYADLWSYDFKSNQWTEMTYSKLATTPPPRSAFNLGLCTSTDTAYVSGGYSKLKNPTPGSKQEGRVHTDCWALNLRGVPSGKSPTWDRVSRRGEFPSVRSGTACVSAYKNRMLVFGGVLDEEGYHHAVKSVFYDDLFAFDMERRRWFRLGLRKSAGGGGGGRRRRRRGAGGAGEEAGAEDQDQDPDERKDHDDGIGSGSGSETDTDTDTEKKEGEAQSSGWDLDRLRQDMFAFIDGDGNVVYEKIEPDEDEGEGEGEGGGGGRRADREGGGDGKSGGDGDGDGEDDDAREAEEEEGGGPPPPESGEPPSDAKPPAAEAAPSPPVPPDAAAVSGVATPVTAGAPPPPPLLPPSRSSPPPRINAAAAVRGNALYVMGGLLEVGDREVTLDDCWRLDLRVRERWECVWPGSMHRQVWRGVGSDDEGSYVSAGVDGGDDEGEGEDEGDSGEGDSGDDEEGGDKPSDPEAAAALKAERKTARKAAKKERRRGIREEMASLRERLDLDDGGRTPRLGEGLSNFYARTSQYWEVRAAERAVVSRQERGAESAAAANSEPLSAKEVKREGFGMARDRYEELRPLLERLDELEGQQREFEGGGEKKKKKDDRKGSKKERGEKKEKKRERRK